MYVELGPGSAPDFCRHVGLRRDDGLRDAVFHASSVVPKDVDIVRRHPRHGVYGYVIPQICKAYIGERLGVFGEVVDLLS